MCSSNVGRALPLTRSKTRRSKRSRGFSAYAIALSLIMDSGCTWHVHPHAEDLLNHRPCSDTVEGIDKKVHPCTLIGDLPIIALDAAGVHRQLLVRDVRCVPSIQDTLVSIDQLWDDAKVDCVFRDLRSVILPGPVTDSRRFPWSREHGLNIWSVVGNARDPARPFEKAMHCHALNVRSVRSSSHISSLPSDAATSVFHRRFHAGVDRLRRMPDLTADAPRSLAQATTTPNSGLVEAAATHLPHSGDRYEPSHAG